MSEKKVLRVQPAVAVLLLVCASFVGGVIALAGAARLSSLAPLGGSSVRADGESASFQNGFSPIVGRSLPAVVNISTSKTVRTSDGRQRAPFSPFFGPGNDSAPSSPVPRERREHALGSGVIVSQAGYLLTNNHVIEGANEISVSLSDKREFKAKLVGADPKTDVAVLKIDGKDLPVMELGDSSRVRVGEFVLAIGNPFGIGETVTMGIVSATGRSGLDAEDYEDFIQTDAAINPGNSGGALVNARGELIGINTLILAGDGGGNQGIGFAIPISMARNVMEQILKNGKVTRGWIGIGIQDLTQNMAPAFGLSEARGVVVTDIAPDGPARKSELAVDDVILEMDGQPVNDVNQFRLSVANTAPGTNVRFKLMRGGKTRETAITLGELPAQAQQAQVAPDSSPLAGMSVDELTADVARQLGLPSRTKGVVISDVSSDSPAADLGLRRGDVITEVNRKPVASVDEFRQALSAAGKGTILLRINRRGSSGYLVVEP